MNEFKDIETVEIGVVSKMMDLKNSEKDKCVNEKEEPVDYEASPRLLYKINESPPMPILLSVAMQNILIGLGGSLTTAYFISDVICAPPGHTIRAKLFCTTCFMTGLCTALQSAIGVRLPIYQSVCSTFLIPLMSMRADDRWKCELQSESYYPRLNSTDSPMNVTSEQTSGPANVMEDVETEMYVKLREMMGCLLLASLLEVLVGATGLVGAILRYIGPLSTAVVVSLIGLSLYKIPMEYAKTHWGLSILCILLIVIFMLYFDRIGIPIPRCQNVKEKGVKTTKLPLFQMFPMLFGIAITWSVCAIMTEAGYFSDNPSSLSYRARTDVRTDVIHGTPWFYFPYPGQFGWPLFNTTIFVGFLSTVVSSIFETIGDYYAAASLAQVPPPPPSAVNRGILLEGLGSVLSGAVGAGHATTSSTGNLVLIGMTKVASRSCLVATGVILMLLSIIGKLGAVLSTMPDPAVGGSMFVMFGILGAIGIFSLKAVDLSSSRNLAIFGLSIYAGIVIPEWVERFPAGLDVGSHTANGVVKGILGTPMFLGGVVAVILDNTVRGTHKERGFHTRIASSSTFTVSLDDTYDVPGMRRMMKLFPWLQCIPFLHNRYDD